MQKRIGVIRGGQTGAGQMAAHSRAAIDRPLDHAAELWVAVARDEALLLGAFQRSRGVVPPAETRPILRRGSGGPEVVVGPGTVHLALSLLHPAALGPCDETRIVNRHVRPLLRALTKTGHAAHFFGRDWISVSHRPAAWVGFAHDATTRRTLFEAFVALRTPFAATPRASFLGKTPVTLEEAAGRPSDPTSLMGAVIDAYARAYDAEPLEVPFLAESESATAAGDPDPGWAATMEEPIGILGAGADAGGVFRVGGDLLVSRDALRRLEALVAQAPEDAIGRIVDETLGAAGVAVDGIRSLASVRDVILRARAASANARGASGR